MRSHDSVKTTLMMRSVTTANAINNQRAFKILANPQTYLNAFKYCRKESIWKASVQLFERDKLKRMYHLFKSGALSLNDVKTCYKSWRGNLIRQYPRISKKTLANFDNLYSKLYGEL